VSPGYGPGVSPYWPSNPYPQTTVAIPPSVTIPPLGQGGAIDLTPPTLPGEGTEGGRHDFPGTESWPIRPCWDDKFEFGCRWVQVKRLRSIRELVLVNDPKKGQYYVEVFRPRWVLELELVCKPDITVRPTSSFKLFEQDSGIQGVITSKF
jgi:hypothetical protein